MAPLASHESHSGEAPSLRTTRPRQLRHQMRSHAGRHFALANEQLLALGDALQVACNRLRIAARQSSATALKRDCLLAAPSFSTVECTLTCWTELATPAKPWSCRAVICAEVAHRTTPSRRSICGSPRVLRPGSLEEPLVRKVMMDASSKVQDGATPGSRYQFRRSPGRSVARSVDGEGVQRKVDRWAPVPLTVRAG